MRLFKNTLLLMVVLCFGGIAFAQNKDVSPTIMRKYSELRTWKYAYRNGASIVVRPDDSSALIQIRAFSPGGALLFPAADSLTAIHAGKMLSKEISATLKGTNITFALEISQQFTRLKMSCKQEELEDALKLISKCFNDRPVVTSPPRLPTMTGKAKAPSLRGSDARKQNDEAIKTIFSSAGNFSFIFTGKLKESSAMNTSKLLPLISSYLGALPSKRDITAEIKAKPNDDHFLAEGTAVLKEKTPELPSGKIIKKLLNGKGPNTQVSLVYHGNYQYSDSVDLQLKVLSALLEEQLSAKTALSKVYVDLVTGKYPQENYQVKIHFECPVKDYEGMVKEAQESVKALQQHIDPEAVKRYVTAQKLLLKKQYFDSDFWSEFFEQKMMKGEDPYDIAHYPYFFRKATPITLQKAAAEYLSGTNYIQLVVLPGKTKHK